MRRFVSWLSVLVAVLACVAVATPARADDKDLAHASCVNRWYTTNFAYSYSGGSVYAGPWVDYWPTKFANEPDSPCEDINVEMATTGAFIVRAVICPETTPCYVVQPNDGWGSINNFTKYGVSVHSYHLPCGGTCDFLFRIETLNSSEQVRTMF